MCSDTWVDVVSPSQAWAALLGDQGLHHHSARPPTASIRALCPCPGLWERPSCSPPQTQGTEKPGLDRMCVKPRLLTAWHNQGCGSVGGTGSRRLPCLCKDASGVGPGTAVWLLLTDFLGEVLNLSGSRQPLPSVGAAEGASQQPTGSSLGLSDLSQQYDAVQVVSTNLSQQTQSCQLTRASHVREGSLSLQAQSGPDHMPLARGLARQRVPEASSQGSERLGRAGLFSPEMRTIRRWKSPQISEGLSNERDQTRPQGHNQAQQK